MPARCLHARVHRMARMRDASPPAAGSVETATNANRAGMFAGPLLPGGDSRVHQRLPAPPATGCSWRCSSLVAGRWSTTQLLVGRAATLAWLCTPLGTARAASAASQRASVLPPSVKAHRGLSARSKQYLSWPRRWQQVSRRSQQLLVTAMSASMDHVHEPYHPCSLTSPAPAACPTVSHETRCAQHRLQDLCADPARSRGAPRAARNCKRNFLARP